MVPLLGRKIALIGGAGFIGHHLALRLKSLGADVVIFDSLAVNNYQSLKSAAPTEDNNQLYLQYIQERLDLLDQAQISLHQIDARDYHLLSESLKREDPDSIIQLAAVSHAGRSNKDPYSTFDHSLRTLENALDVARSLKIRHFVYFSSSMVYGNFVKQEVTEDTPCNPMGIYGALKFAGEKIVIAYHQVFGLPYTIIRPSALYGARCISRRVNQVFIENALRNEPLMVRGDGSERLDFTYIDDLVDGVVRVLDRTQGWNDTFNLTYGQSRSVRELLQIISHHFPDVQIRYEPRDGLMPQRGTLCIDKARDRLGYRPRFPLEKGLDAYVRWFRSYPFKNAGVVR